MSSQKRYRGGVMKMLHLPTAGDGDTTPAHAFEDGDLVYVTGGVAYPASHLADQGDAAANRAAFGPMFAGVAIRKTGLQTGEKSFKLTTDPGVVLVATSGIFEYPCAATSWKPNDLVAVYADADGCYDQQVASTAVYAEVIGTAVVPLAAIGTSQTSILVDIRPLASFDQVSSGV